MFKLGVAGVAKPVRRHKDVFNGFKFMMFSGLNTTDTTFVRLSHGDNVIKLFMTDKQECL